MYTCIHVVHVFSCTCSCILHVYNVFSLAPTNQQVIGSSLLFVYDSTDLCSVHLIDFGKTIPLSSDVSIDHRSEWVEGNHEDGYLWGLDNLIRLWSEIRMEQYASPVKHRMSYGRSNSAMAL